MIGAVPAIFLAPWNSETFSFSSPPFLEKKREVDDSFIIRVASFREIAVLCKSNRRKLLFSSGSRRGRDAEKWS